MAKFYVFEPQSKAVRQRLDAEDEVCVSELVRPELMGVFHRRLREGKWKRADFLAAVRQFSADDIAGYWKWLPLNRAILEAAATIYTTLPETIFLRTADCLHLTTALHHNFAEIHTHDKQQASAAVALGLKPVSIS